MAILILLGSSLLMVFLYLPIIYAVALPSTFCLLYRGHNLTTTCQQMVEGVSSFSLMAVPFSTIMNYLTGSGGVSEKLIVLANACVSRMRGGMAMINIITSCSFGGASGSTAVNMTSLSFTLVPTMVDQGYDGDFSITVTVTSSCEGPLVPSSHSMVIYVTMARGISVGSLFLAEYIPEAFLTVPPMIGSYITSVKCNYPKRGKFSITSLTKQSNVSFWVLAVVLIVVFSVVDGVFTIVESVVIVVIHSLIVSVFVYGGLGWKGVWRVPGDCADTLSIAMIPITTSSIFGFCLTQLHVSVLVVSAIIGVTNNPIIPAPLPNPVLLVLGYIMDMAPTTLITTPTLLPTATPVGLGLTQFDIMAVFNRGIGLLAPLVGIVLFIGSAMTKVPMECVVKATLPFYPCMIIILLLTTFVPAVST